MAVDDEPVVFWDGADAHQRVEQWRRNVGFREGDAEGAWGFVRAAGNGTSGRSVVERVLAPMGIAREATWFTDAVDRFFVKSGGWVRQQAEAMAEAYAPFADRAALPPASLPSRPSASELIRTALQDHRERLLTELAEAAPPLAVTLGEEARQVLLGLVDDAQGPPTQPLDSRRLGGNAAGEYGEAGRRGWHVTAPRYRRGMAEITVLGPAFSNAVAYAAWLHRDQRRKDTAIPYMSHLLAVASLVLDQGGDEDEAIAALLHDALEDQWRRTSEDEIRQRFGDKVARIVVACSASTGGEKGNWQARKEAYLEHLRVEPDEVLRVSLADKLHNARAIVADLRTVGDKLWRRFTGTPDQQAWYYDSLLEILRARNVSPLVVEFEVAVAELQERAAAAGSGSA